MDVTVQEFLTTGRLGRLELGQSSTDVRAILGNPSDVSKFRPPLIWQYGSLELSFDSPIQSDVDRLILIGLYFRDKSRRLRSPFVMRDWFPRFGTTKVEMEEQLRSIQVPITVVKSLCNEDTLAVETPIGVSILYDLTETEATLYSIQYMSRG